MAKKSDPIEEDKRKTIMLVLKQQKERHKMNMMELFYSRESEKIRHEHEMERQRIKTAEIRKMQERKDFYNYSRANYSRANN